MVQVTGSKILKYWKSCLCFHGGRKVLGILLQSWRSSHFSFAVLSYPRHRFLKRKIEISLCTKSESKAARSAAALLDSLERYWDSVRMEMIYSEEDCQLNSAVERRRLNKFLRFFWSWIDLIRAFLRLYTIRWPTSNPCFLNHWRLALRPIHQNKICPATNFYTATIVQIHCASWATWQ